MPTDSPIISDILSVFSDIFSDIVGGNVGERCNPGPPRSYRYPTWYSPPFIGHAEVSGKRSQLQTNAKKHEKCTLFIIFLALFLYHDSLRFPGPHLDQDARKSLIINNRHFLHRKMINVGFTPSPTTSPHTPSHTSSTSLPPGSSHPPPAQSQTGRRPFVILRLKAEESRHFGKSKKRR